jgi:ubiquinone biosynthesis protein COQ9
MALRAFPGGVVELLEFFIAEADRHMLDALARTDLSALKVRERIATAVRLRLEAETPHKEAVRKALAVLALPIHAGRALKCLYRTVDAIWYAAGDTATDFNFYTKRGLLAAVYGATMLYWLDDRSAGSVDTDAFLDRRIADVMAIPKLTRRLGEIVDRLPNPARFWRAAQRR